MLDCSNSCSVCGEIFEKKRSNQKYCGRKCQKNSSRRNRVVSAPRCRFIENKKRNEDHYTRSCWLTYDVYRLPGQERDLMIQQIVEAASGEDAKLRNILLDPKLLAASWNSQEGRFEYDRKLGIPNISKQAYWFCQEQYGCSTRDAILDDGKPAYRKFLGDTSSQTLSKHKEEVPLSTRMLKNLRTLGELKLENSTSGLRERAYKLLLISKMAEIVSGPAAVLLAA